MTLSTSLKTASLALALILATAGASFAQTATLNTDADVLSKPLGMTVNWVEQDDQVKVITCSGNPQSLVGSWCKIKIPGQDGWVRQTSLDFIPMPLKQPNNNPGNGSFCVTGQNGSFCVTI